ncbi:hypothetical protein LEAN103870_06280 [Legionella anisa]|uniref:DUF3012 domain-containing protein n=1 Tax=Legionella anisa TaxID=28082 RepID=A0AAX0WQ94_9GAMM|nr:hypothetical protein [Legionella anisa]AWN75571.1 hypothetical protein DLD14_17970 [Legionella anisa]KTC76360.1 hypothetical protein Lani_0433 [Legionella anisa]MBN5935974.1 hypothetical protein [Legionella anisa]MCW8424237.1 hypothetical protein [Legionella anisa]MCW8446645.1 hypothetical protein [Legionella anisa]
MNRSFLKGISIFALTMLFSLSANADSAGGDFQTRCTDAWMKKADEAKDKVDFKNFGEKYCGCAAKLPLDNEAAVQKAVKVCMSRTLLHDAMDSIEDDVGLSKAKDSDITDYCKDRWELVLPKPTDEDKKFITAYCECAKPKLVELLKKSNDMTDKQYYDEIDGVADTCADSEVASKSSSTN